MFSHTQVAHNRKAKRQKFSVIEKWGFPLCFTGLSGCLWFEIKNILWALHHLLSSRSTNGNFERQKRKNRRETLGSLVHSLKYFEYFESWLFIGPARPRTQTLWHHVVKLFLAASFEEEFRCHRCPLCTDAEMVSHCTCPCLGRLKKIQQHPSSSGWSFHCAHIRKNFQSSFLVSVDSSHDFRNIPILVLSSIKPFGVTQNRCHKTKCMNSWDELGLRWNHKCWHQIWCQQQLRLR